ncbi:polyribonucleotide nucleotidyltransferase [Patescibacteria group bacterium]|nr:polyribonucleotide nucleotidyltransferase [Patescibacteria group bacterium]
MKKSITKKIEVAGRELSFEINKVAPQANASVIARYGDTEVLATVMLGAEKAYSDGGAPVTVDFVERLYAGGIIKGSRWVKREGRPTDEAILTNRLIDRSIRPLFPKDMANEVQIIVTLLSTDNANDHDVLALNAVSMALAVSNIPWNGPVAAVRMGYVSKDDAGYVVNPLTPEMEFSDLDLVVSSSADGVIMIEAGAKQLPEDKANTAVEKALEEDQKIVEFIKDIQKEAGQDKYPYKSIALDEDLIHEIEKKHGKEIEEFVEIKSPESKMDGSRVEEYKKALTEEYAENPNKNQIPQIVDYLFKKALRKKTLETKKRVDGRKFADIRPISAEVGLLPRTHGSGLFQRGLTQVLSVVTLANPSLEQWIETAEGMEEKRYIHHYNAPPYSSGEVGRIGGLGRREIGHGALAERALEPVIPTEEQFPYTIRVVSEVLSQNGSSSMGSTCGSTLALMDAGVPILAPVSGVAMGLIAESTSEYAILTDLRGEEDFYGNMDFKVAGTETGITAIQLDIKLNDKFRGLTMKMVKEILAQAREGRLEILKKMLVVIPESRKAVSQYAPKVVTMKIPVDKIGEVIGPGGKNIKNIIATTGAAVDIEDDGTVTISAIDEAAVEQARAWIDGQTRELQPGEEFEGEVKRILPFGAFVEVLPGKEGLVHVSRMTSGYVGNPEEVVHIGQKVKVRVMEIDEMGRLNLAMYWGPKDENAQPPMGQQPGGFRPRGGFSGPRRSGFGGRGGFDRNRGGRRDRY